MRLFNPRARYLTGMGILSPSQPRHRYRGMGAFNPRMRYLTGLGSIVDFADSSDDGSDDTSGIDLLPQPQPVPLTPDQAGISLSPAPISTTLTAPTYASPSYASLTPSTGVFAGGILPSSVPAGVTSFLTTTNPSIGISNGVLVAGLGFLVLLAALSGGNGSSRRRNGRRRRR